MNNLHGKDALFSRESLAASIHVWNRAAISLIDIRHNLISPGEALHGYPLPASAFLYTSGRAEILLNDTAYTAERFSLFHGGKGTALTITPYGDWLEYYMVLYKAGEPPFLKREYAKLFEQENPFRQQYGFAPNNPLYFSEQLRKIYECWKKPTPLNLLHSKAAFHELVFEIYKELEQGKIHRFEPDVIAMAKRFLDEHYAEEISIQELCGMLGISYSHFHRSFKQQSGRSPQDYLIHTRWNAAVEFLKTSDASLREIAVRCGLTDEQRLYRLFVKKTGLSPSAYREKLYTQMRDDTLQNTIPFPYTWESQVSLVELKGKGATYMFRRMRNKTMVAAALSLMLMLCACGTEPASTSSGGSALPAAVASQVPEKEETRIVKTGKGDIEVPANPQRVIVDGSLRGDVVALGVIPVATQNFYNTGVAYDHLTTDTVVLEKWEPEYLMAQNPDLIITIYEEDFDKFSGFAPTIVVSESQLSTVERVSLIAQALGKDITEATKLIDTYTQKVDDAKKLLKEKGFYNYTFSIVRTGGDNQIDVRWGNVLGGQFLFGEFGLSLPKGALAEIEKGETVGGAFSFEALPTYMGDYILVNESNENDYETLMKNPIWQSIPAVKENHVFVIPASFLYFGDVYSKSAQLDLIMEKLLEIAPPQ